jgi:hypothetical protein
MATLRMLYAFVYFWDLGEAGKIPVSPTLGATSCRYRSFLIATSSSGRNAHLTFDRTIEKRVPNGV